VAATARGGVINGRPRGEIWLAASPSPAPSKTKTSARDSDAFTSLLTVGTH
jgi:hypothetical protein